MDYRVKIGLHVAGIVAIVVLSLVLIQQDVLNPGALFVAGVVCWQWGVYVWTLLQAELRNTIRIVNRNLSKSGFVFEQSEWLDPNANDPTLRYNGTFNGEHFLIDMQSRGSFIRVVDLPWFDVKANDPIVPQLLEAINDTNGQSSNMSVVLTPPDDEGNRSLLTMTFTVLPSYRTDSYLRYLFTEMLNRKAALHENFQRERPWMKQKRGPIGFAVQREEAPRESAKPTTANRIGNSPS